MDRRDSVTADELGASAFGISVNNMVGRFNELDRLQELARTAEEDREKALNLEAENRNLKEELASLRKSELSASVGSRNYKMENIALRALQQQSNKTIAMLQEKLKDHTDIIENFEDPVTLANIASSAPIVVGDSWKLSGRKTDSVMPLYPVGTTQQMPGQQSQQYPDQNYNNIGPGGFIIPGQLPGTPLPHSHSQQQHKQRPTHYLPPLESEPQLTPLPALNTDTAQKTDDSTKLPVATTNESTEENSTPENDTSKTTESTNVEAPGAPPPPPPPPPPPRKFSPFLYSNYRMYINFYTQLYSTRRNGTSPAPTS